MTSRTAPLPLVDLAPWREGRDPTVADAVDEAFASSGFLLVTGHGVDPDLVERARASAHAFFALPTDAKAACIHGGPAYRGWFGPGTQSNAATYGLEATPDLKEVFSMGTEVAPPGMVDERTFGANVFPAEIPEMRVTWSLLHTELQGLADTLVEVCELALGFVEGDLTRHFVGTGMNMVANWYPAAAAIDVVPGGMRIGPHTDFGTLTIVDRRPSPAGLQIHHDGEWLDVPHVPGAFAVNVGDLLAHWTGGRWRSTFHRVPAPDPDHPEEEHLSIVAFHRPVRDAIIEPIDGGEPVRCGDWMDAKMAALAIGGSS